MSETEKSFRDVTGAINDAIDAQLQSHGFVRKQSEARWLRLRSEEFQDCLVISYGKRYFPAILYCTPMVSVYCPPMLKEIKRWFGARFAENDFGAKNLGGLMPEGLFRSWEYRPENRTDKIGMEIADAFLHHGLPIVESINSYSALKQYIGQSTKVADAHNKLLRNIAPCCLAYLAGDLKACASHLTEMLALHDELNDGNQFEAKFLPQHAKLENFLCSLGSSAK